MLGQKIQKTATRDESEYLNIMSKAFTKMSVFFYARTQKEGAMYNEKQGCDALLNLTVSTQTLRGLTKFIQKKVRGALLKIIITL